MKKSKASLTLTSIIPLVAVCGAALAGAETLTVPSTNENGVWSSPLAAGQVYRFTATGTYRFNGETPAGLADAEFVFQFSALPPSQVSEYFLWLPGGPNGETNDVLDLVINRKGVDWLGSTDGLNYSPHTYSPNHTYEYLFTGTGSPVEFLIADNVPFGGDATFDNAGSLNVTIDVVPEPTSLGVIALGFGLMRLGGTGKRQPR